MQIEGLEFDFNRKKRGPRYATLKLAEKRHLAPDFFYGSGAVPGQAEEFTGLIDRGNLLTERLNDADRVFDQLGIARSEFAAGDVEIVFQSHPAMATQKGC